MPMVWPCRSASETPSTAREIDAAAGEEAAADAEGDARHRLPSSRIGAPSGGGALRPAGSAASSICV